MNFSPVLREALYAQKTFLSYVESLSILLHLPKDEWLWHMSIYASTHLDRVTQLRATIWQFAHTGVVNESQSPFDWQEDGNSAIALVLTETYGNFLNHEWPELYNRELLDIVQRLDSLLVLLTQYVRQHKLCEMVQNRLDAILRESDHDSLRTEDPMLLEKLDQISFLSQAFRPSKEVMSSFDAEDIQILRASLSKLQTNLVDKIGA